MVWVAIDRGLRLSDKRSLPLSAKQRSSWLAARDAIYGTLVVGLSCSIPLAALIKQFHFVEEVMDKGWNQELEFFPQSYEGQDIADSAVLIMPLVSGLPSGRGFTSFTDDLPSYSPAFQCFFISAADPRFRKTLDRILSPPEKGGLQRNNVCLAAGRQQASHLLLTAPLLSTWQLISRYDTSKVDDGLGGSEGSFTLCTLWAIEALARAGAYEPELLPKATAMLEDLLGYGNHVGLFVSHWQVGPLSCEPLLISAVPSAVGGDFDLRPRARQHAPGLLGRCASPLLHTYRLLPLLTASLTHAIDAHLNRLQPRSGA